MAKESRSTQSTYWLVLAGIGAAGLLTALAARARAVQQRKAISPPAPVTDTSPPSVTPLRDAPPVPPEPAASPVPTRPALYLALVAACAAALIALQNAAPQAAAAAFMLLIGASVGLTGWRLRGLLAAQVAGRAGGLGGALRGVQAFAGVEVWARRRRVPLSVLMAAGGLALLALAAWSFQVARLGERPLDEALFFVVTGAAALWSALLLRRGAAGELPAKAAAAVPLGRANWLLTGAGIALLAVLAEASGDVLRLEPLRRLSPHGQMALLVVGAALVAWGLGGGWRALRSPTSAAESRQPTRTTLLLLAVLALAFWVRTHELGTAVHYLVDEMNTIPEVAAFQYSLNPVRLITQMSGISPFPWVFAYGQWAGTLFLGNTLEGIRLASAVTGTLTVLALYLLARALFDRPTALAAALLLATFPPHVHFSRLALLNIADPLVGTLGLAFLGRGLVRQRRLDYALGGVFLGLTQYFYNGGRMFYIPLAVVWVGLVAVSRQPDTPRRSLDRSAGGYRAWLGAVGAGMNWSGLRTALLALLITAAPIYTTILARGYPLIGRMEASGLNGDYWRELIADGRYSEYLYRLGWAFRFYVQMPDDTVYYGGDTPLVLPLLVPVFLAGVAYCLYHWRRPGPALLVLWLAAAALGNSILVMSAASTRFVIAFPLLPLLVAVGIRYLLPLFGPPRVPALALRLRAGEDRTVRFRWPPRDLPRHVRRAVVVVALAAAAVQTVYYWQDHLAAYNRQLRIHHAFPDGYDAVFRSMEFPERTEIHILSASPFSQMDAQGLLDFLLGTGVIGANTLATEDLNQFYIDTLRCGRDHAFFIEPGDMRTLALLQQNFYLRPPEYSPDRDVIPDERELVLYYAPFLPGLEERYHRKCNNLSGT